MDIFGSLGCTVVDNSWAASSDRILDNLGDACICIDDDWNIVFVNRATEILWHREWRDLIGRNLLRLFPQLVGSPKERLIGDALRSGERKRFEAVSLVSGTPMEFDVHPLATGAAILMRDVREQWRLKEEVAERDALLRMGEDAAGLGIWEIAPTTDTVRGTEQYFRIMGLEPTDKPVPMSRIRSLRPTD